MAGETLKSPFLHKRGTSTRISSYAGPRGEIVIDTNKDTVVVQNGSAGGQALAVASTAIIAGHGISVNGGTLGVNNTIGLAAVSTVTEGTYGPSENASASLGSTTINVPAVSVYVDAYGRVTSATTRSLSLSLAPATNTTLGGVMVASGGGLVVDSAGLLSVDSSAIPPSSDIPDFGTVGGVQQPVYFSSGVPVAGSAPLYSVPQASDSILGGVKVSGGGIAIDNTGTLSVSSLNTVSAGGVQQPIYFSSGVPVAGSAPLYSVPQASDSILGGVKIGSGLSITSAGVLSAEGGTSVSVTPVVSSGTKIATITVDSTPTDLYVPRSEGGSSNVVGTPVISGNDYCVAEHDYEFSFYTYTALNNVTIEKFVIDGGALGTAEVTAVANSGQYSFTIPSNAVTGSTYTISIYAVDSLGNQGDAATKTITVNTVYIETPEIQRDSIYSHFVYTTWYKYSSSSSTAATEGLRLSLSAIPKIVGAEDTIDFWEIKVCSDIAGNNILLNKQIASLSVGSSTVVFTSSEFSEIEVQTLYVFCRVKYVNYDVSNWSTSLKYILVKVGDTPIALVGREMDRVVVEGQLPIHTGDQSVQFLVQGNNESSNSYQLAVLSTLEWTNADFIICTANTPNANIVFELRNQALSVYYTFVQRSQWSSLPLNQTLYCFARVSTDDGSTWSAWSEPALLQIVPATVNGYEVVNKNDNDYISKTNGRILPLVKHRDFGTPASYTVTNVTGTLKNSATGSTLKTYALDSAPTNVTIASSDISSISVGNKVEFDVLTTYTQDDTTKTYLSSSLYTVTNNIITPSGRTLYRHSTNIGSVLQLNMFGRAVDLLVLDGAYRSRGNLKWGTYNITTTPFKKFSSKSDDTTGLYVGRPYVGTSYIYSDFTSDAVNNAIYVEGATGGTNVGSYATIAPVTDAQLQARFAPLYQDQTARANCDQWMEYQGVEDYASSKITGVPAVEYARGLTVGNMTGGFDIPNLYEVLVLYIEGDWIDALDPTLADYPQNALGKFTHANTRWMDYGVVWSSTECSAANQWLVYFSGYAGDGSKGNTFSAVPVRELNS